MENKTLRISGIPVSFPCKPYPSQLSMMDKVIKGIDRRLNCLLESPTGSGKSLALLCSSLAWQAEEKAKKEQEDTQALEKGLCTCECHNEVTAPSNEIPKAPAKENGPTETEKEPVEAGQQTDLCVDDGNDFRSDTFCFNKPSSKVDCKNIRKHITISYEEDKGTTAKHDSPCTPKEEMLTLSDSCNCLKCPCSSENLPKRKIPKIFFGTRTHKQVAQIVRELRKTSYHEVKMTILGSREHTCIHPEVSRMKKKNEGCKELLNGPGCPLKDRVLRYTTHNVIKHHGLNTAWDLEDLVNLCRPKKVCPYFLCRGLKEDADLIICPYNYLVDPLIREALQINLKGHIVIFDEAHNIEDSAREAASQSITQENITSAISDIEILMESHNLADYSKLRHMLKNLDSFMNDNKDKLEQKDFNQSYKIWNGFYIVAQLETLGLGPKHFSDLKAALASIKRDAEERKEEALREGWKPDLVEMKTGTENLIDQIFMVMDYLYRFDLKYVEDYRASLVHSVSFTPKHSEGQWLSTKNRGRGQMVPVDIFTLNFWCMNPGVAFSDFSETRSVILTSGTLSPLGSFQSELGLEFKIQLEANHVIKDSQVWVGTLGQGPSGSSLQAVFRNLETYTFQDELGNLILKVCEAVPHGVLCFLPSYKVLEKLCNRWESTRLMDKIRLKKIVLCEPRGSDKADFELKMQQFYQAVNESDGSHAVTDDDGNDVNGAVMFAVCRGKVSEGLDFADNFARAVISVGIPYPNFKDVQVELKRKYNDEHCQSRSLLTGHAWYEIQAFRALNQALGRCIRHRNDWGALIIVDDRFVKNPQKYTQGLSKWVRNKIHSFDRFGGALTSLNAFVAQSKMREEENQASDVEKSLLSPPPTPVLSSKSSPQISAPQTPTYSPSPPKTSKNFSIFEPLPKRKAFHQGRENQHLNTSNISKPVTQTTVTSLFNINKQNAVDSCKAVSSPSSSHAYPLKIQANLGSIQGTQTARNLLPATSSSECLAPNQEAKQAKDFVSLPSNSLPSHTKSLPESCNKAKGVFVLNKSGTLRVETDFASQGVSRQLFKIPHYLYPLYGGDLNLPVSHMQKFVYIIKPPSSVGSPPMARVLKTINQQFVPQLSSDNPELDEKSGSGKKECQEAVSEAADKSTVLFKTNKVCEITTQKSNSIQAAPSSSPDKDSVADKDPSFLKENYNSKKSEEEPLNGIVYSDFESRSESTVKDNKLDPGNEGNPFLKFSKLGRRGETCHDSSGSPELDAVGFEETAASPSPLLFSPKVREQSNESSNLCTKKPLFKKKKLINLEELKNPLENLPSVVGLPASSKEVEKEEKCSNLRRTSSKLLEVAVEDINSDFVTDSAEDKLVLKRKSRRRRSSSLKRGNEKKIKKEDSFVVEDSQEERNAAFSCLSCGSDLFEDGNVSDFVKQRVVPPFLSQDSEDDKKSGCVFFNSVPAKSSLQALPEGLPGLSLKYIEPEEICVQFVYCGQCLKESKKDNSDMPIPLGAQVQLAAGSSARFRKGQLWLFLHSVNQKKLYADKMSKS